MRPYAFVLCATLAIAACNKGATNAENTADQNAMADPNAQNMMMTDQNAAMANGAGGMDMNTATNSATENQMAKDMNTNDKDTNLANGM